MKTATVSAPASTTAAPKGFAGPRPRLVAFEPSNSWIKRCDDEGPMVIQAAWADLGRLNMQGSEESPLIVENGTRRVYGTGACTMNGHTTPDKQTKAAVAREMFKAVLRPTDDMQDLEVTVSHWNLATAQSIAHSLKGQYSVTRNGREIRCTVVRTHAVLEGEGSWYLAKSLGLLMGGPMLLVELGHGTTEEWVVSEAGQLVGAPTEALAVRQLVGRIADHPSLLQFAGADSRGYSHSLITAALRTGKTPNPRLPQQAWEAIVQGQVATFRQELFAHLTTAHAATLQAVGQVLVTGGGAALLGKLPDLFTVLPDPQTASVRGALLMAQAKVNH